MADPSDILPLESVPALSKSVSAQRVVNAYAERSKSGAKAGWVRYGSPGIVTGTTCGVGPVRALHEMNSLLYAVSGSSIYSIASNYVATELAAGIVGTGPVSIANNGTQIMIVNGQFGWTYDATAGLQQATSVFFYAANTTDFFDDYFLFPRNGTNNFFHSDLLDGQGYVFDNFASAESDSDYVVAVKALGQHLYVFGTRTIEPWYDAGAADFPFRRYDGAAIKRGCIAPMTVVQIDTRLFFLGDDYRFYALSGGSPTPLSNSPIEQHWQKLSRVDDAHCVPFNWDGHTFVNVVFPSANEVWCVDTATGLWHERESFDDQMRIIRWRANCTAKAYGKTWIGDYLSGKVGSLDDTVFTEFDEPFTSELVTPNLSNGGRRGFMPALSLDIQAGVGLNTGQGTDPKWMLDWSDNGSDSYEPYVMERSAGLIGHGTQRVIFDRLGSFYQRTMRLRCSDPVKRVVIGGYTPRLRWGTMA